jgi:hypothetical protein
MEIPKEIAERIKWKDDSRRPTYQGEDEIVAIRPLDPICGGCGSFLESARTVSVTYNPKKKGVCVKKCDSCKKVYNPETEKYDLHYTVGVNLIQKINKKLKKDK